MATTGVTIYAARLLKRNNEDSAAARLHQDAPLYRYGLRDDSAAVCRRARRKGAILYIQEVYIALIVADRHKVTDDCWPADAAAE
jgi:hypothetical protein